MPQSDLDAVTQTRLDVAEMKGMLTMALQNHGERITGLEAERDKLHNRINEKGQRITVVEGEVKEMRADVVEVRSTVAAVEERQHGQFGRSLQTLVGLAAVAGFALSAWQYLGGA